MPKNPGLPKSENVRLISSIGLPLAVPLVIGSLLYKAMKTPWKSTGRVLNWVKKNAHHFDYQKGFWMSIPTICIPIAMQYVGHILSARSPRERRENIIRETMLNFLFIWGNAMWMNLLAKPILKAFKLPPIIDLEKLTKTVPLKRRASAKRIGAIAYSIGFAASCLTVVGSILLNNWLTKRNVQNAVSTIDNNEIQKTILQYR